MMYYTLRNVYKVIVSNIINSNMDLPIHCMFFAITAVFIPHHSTSCFVCAADHDCYIRSCQNIWLHFK